MTPLLHLLDQPARNWAKAWRDLAIATLASGFAWWLARIVSGDRAPVFAAIAAIVCLAPGVANRRRQAIGMLTGVAIGIVIGEAARRVPGVDQAARTAGATFVAMLAATSFGLNAVTVIQAGGSAVLVVGSLQPDAAHGRLVDAAIGALVGLACSQVLFTADPVPDVRQAARRLLAAAIASLAAIERTGGADDGGLDGADVVARGLAELRTADIGLATAIDAANAAIEATLRGRLSGRRIRTAVDALARAAVRVAPSLQLLADRNAPAIDDATRAVLRTEATVAIDALRRAIDASTER